MNKNILDAQDASIFRQRDFRFMDLAAFLCRRVKILLAILDPLDRLPQLHGNPGQDHLFGVEHHDLWPKTAADERCNHPDLFFRKPQHRGDPIANRNGCLGRVVHRKLFSFGIPTGHNPAIFHRGRGATVIVKAALDDQIRLLLSYRIVTLALDGMGVEVLR